MKPVMGYPSQTAAIRALNAKGMRRSEIAQLLGMKTKDVTSAALTATKHRAKSFAYDKPQQVYLGLETIAALKPYADARGIMPTKLVQMLIDTVVRDGMVDAVLDDREQVA
jgi:hypothetical protein